ncbi:MAG: saccharopine dehydrogenase family protein [Syntrophobacteraceae bacterium]
MRVLLLGVGGVGQAMAVIANRRDPDSRWMEQMVLADYDLTRAQTVSAGLKNPERFPAEQVDARNSEQITALVRKYKIDTIMNGCDPSFNETIFDTAYAEGCNYMDCAMTLSKPHPDHPYTKPYVKLGDYQFARHEQWAKKNILAIVGSGVEPGMADVYARYAEKHLFDEIEEIGIRDGANLSLEGASLTFGFSIWATIEECLNPPLVWERDKGWYTLEPFSEPEIFTLPDGIGDVEMVHVEHEEVALIPRYIDKGLRKVSFKYGLGEEFINCLKALKSLNLDSKEKTIPLGGQLISARDFVAKCAPNPIEIQRRMVGKTCAGTWVKGIKDGMTREVYLYQVADNEDCLERLDCHAVVAQTAFNPVLMMELLARGIWNKVGVHGAEAFDPDPFVELMDDYEFPGGMTEMDSEYKSALDARSLREPLAMATA